MAVTVAVTVTVIVLMVVVMVARLEFVRSLGLVRPPFRFRLGQFPPALERPRPLLIIKPAKVTLTRAPTGTAAALVAALAEFALRVEDAADFGFLAVEVLVVNDVVFPADRRPAWLWLGFGGGFEVKSADGGAGVERDGLGSGRSIWWR